MTDYRRKGGHPLVRIFRENPMKSSLKGALYFVWYPIPFQLWDDKFLKLFRAFQLYLYVMNSPSLVPTWSVFMNDEHSQSPWKVKVWERCAFGLEWWTPPSLDSPVNIFASLTTQDKVHHFIAFLRSPRIIHSNDPKNVHHFDTFNDTRQFNHFRHINDFEVFTSLVVKKNKFISHSQEVSSPAIQCTSKEWLHYMYVRNVGLLTFLVLDGPYFIIF